MCPPAPPAALPKPLEGQGSITPAVFGMQTTPAQGQSRHFDRTPTSSGLRRLADIFHVRRHVSKVP
jgi:hypothetical protein